VFPGLFIIKRFNMETKPQKTSAENYEREIPHKTGRLFTSEQKILIVMEAIRGENRVAEICRKYGIHQTQFYKWNNQFLEAGKKLLEGDTIRETTIDEVTELRKENQRLKEMVADLMLRYDNVKKGLSILE
jgi:transposase